MVNYQQLEDKLANLQEYKHGSSHAIKDSGMYTVYSYRTEMLRVIYEPSTDTWEVAYYNDKYYSMTTSRLQRIIKRHFDVYNTVRGIER